MLAAAANGRRRIRPASSFSETKKKFVSYAPLITAVDGSLMVLMMLPVPMVAWASNGRPRPKNTAADANRTTCRDL